MIMERQLVLPQDIEDYEWELESKGYFLGAAVLVGEQMLSVTFYEPVRLAQDIAEELSASRVFAVRRLLIVEKVTLEHMREAVVRAPSEVFE
ncbi:MAG: hypothetical protein ACRC0L_09325 [Angustibacter sp.]